LQTIGSGLESKAVGEVAALVDDGIAGIEGEPILEIDGDLAADFGEGLELLVVGGFDPLGIDADG
jgi:hypothetical protein